MVTTYEAIWASGDDILKLRNGFKEELEAHVSQPIGIPLHRYEGQLTLKDDGILLLGKERDSRAKFRLFISFGEIKDRSLGWDDVLRRWKDTRAWIKPLRLTFGNYQKPETLYIYAKTEGVRPYGSENEELLKNLNVRLK